MVAFQMTCDPQRLQKLLSDELPEMDEARATDHISRCATCRATLEELAAGEPWWHEASRLLQGSQWSDGTLSLSTRDFALAAAEEGRLCNSGVKVTASADDGPSTSDDSTVTSLEFLEPSDDPGMLGRLGRYEILAVLGSGGFGIVLKGYDRELNRLVAVKVLAPHLSHNAAARKRFAREAQAAAAVVHPHVVAIHAIEAAGPLPYLVMPLIAGESLQDRLNQTGPLEVKEILRIGLQIAQGLAAAHAQGVVHRDVKPANILLERGVDRVMLTDFGLARAMDDASLTRSMVIAGTPQYMSPEQAQGNAIDLRTDLFSLGSVLYAMCTGHAPFRAETLMGVLRRISDGSPREVRELNSDIPDWLSAIIAKLHAPLPEHRFASAAELAALLEGCLAHLQQPAQSPLPFIPGLPTPELRRAAGSWRKAAVWGIPSVAAVLLATAAGIWLRFFAEPNLERSSEPVRTARGTESQTEVRSGTVTQGENVLPPNEARWVDQTEQEIQSIGYQLRSFEWALVTE